MTRIRFLNKEWRSAHAKEIKKRAGSRYTPKLNVDLPIADIFEGLSRTENFYTAIRTHRGKLNREFRQISSKYVNSEIQKIYTSLRLEISSLLNILAELKEYSTKNIPWEKINKFTKSAEDITWRLSGKLREEKEKTAQQKTEAESGGQRSASEKLGSDIHYLYETQRELRYFKELSLSSKAKLSNTPFLLLTGVAGTGKTHLLCDVVKNRTVSKKSLPAVLVFGELFATSESPIFQIVKQLGLKLRNGKFLRMLDKAGQQSGCRAIIAIDALNETRQRNFWKRNLGRVVDEVRKYPNIALVVSIRTGFEDEVTAKKLRKVFICEEHRGFEFREWEAVSKFFKEFGLPLPEIPLLTPEFQNPLFLLLFCKAFRDRAKKNSGKNQKQIFRGHEGATYIFEAFVDSVSKRLSKQFGLSNASGENIWDTIIKKIAERLVVENSDRISEDQVLELVRNAYPSINHTHFIKELDGNLLLVKVPRYSTEKKGYDGFDFRFPFQKFSDHLIGRFLFKKYEEEVWKSNKNLGTAKKFFSKRRKLGRSLSQSWNRGIVEALSIQCPEHLNGCELVEAAPYLWNSDLAAEAFIESLIWRKPDAFSEGLKNTLFYINEKIIKTESRHNSLLNAFLSVAPIPNHLFNADFLHKHLSKFSMAKRDSWWSTFLHDQHGEKGAVDRLIEWGRSEQDKRHINDESIRLCSTALAWFLTTPNRFVRDKSTKALVSLLTERRDVVLDLLKRFKDVNDLYIGERLYAVAYGCVLRFTNDRNGLKALAEWVYQNVFKNGHPPEHVLLRDYARGIIEVALQNKIKLQINQKRICPPYGSQFPKNLPSNRTIKKFEFDYKDKDFKDHFWAQNSIIHSMQPEYSTIFLYGDFGRYVFQSALSKFDYPNSITMQGLSNWATQRVFDLGYDVNIHGKFDRYVNYHRADRSAHKAERVGKKYQWIAFHELLAKVSDNFRFKKESWSDKVEKYEGPWQLGIRDIDPSCLMKEFPNATLEGLPGFEKYKEKWHYDAWNKKISDLAWLKKAKDLPPPDRVIELCDDQGNQWVALEGFIEWQEQTLPEYEKFDLPTRKLWYMLKSYLIHKEDSDKIFSWAKQKNFMGRWMPESHEFYNIYLGEYPWAPAFLSHYNPHDDHSNGWPERTGDRKIPAQVLVTDDQYLSNGSSTDCSIGEAITIKLPAKYIVDEMDLIQPYIDGRFFDKKGDLVVFDPTIFDANMPRFLIMRKDTLCDFLHQKKHAILWTLLGEKNMIGGEYSGRKWIGRLELSGAYTLDEKNKIIGEMNSSFRKP